MIASCMSFSGMYAGINCEDNIIWIYADGIHAGYNGAIMYNIETHKKLNNKIKTFVYILYICIFDL